MHYGCALVGSMAESGKREMKRSSNLKWGILLILVATFGIVPMNTCAKMSSVAHNPLEMIFYRGIIASNLFIVFREGHN